MFSRLDAGHIRTPDRFPLVSILCGAGPALVAATTGMAFRVLVVSVLLASAVLHHELCAEDLFPDRSRPVPVLITGTPDPPPMLQTRLRYPNLKFDQPLLIRRDPAGERMFVVERGGRIWSFPDVAEVDAPTLALDLAGSFDQLVPHENAQRVDAAYALAFHPRYPEVPYCWIVYILRAKPGQPHLEDGTRLSRFRVRTGDDGSPRIDPSSEQVVLTWLEGGHNGSCLEFGPDGMLYVSAGDGEVPNPPDPRDAGQDVSNLLSTILRIDVSTSDSGPLYTSPGDNPFVRLEGARPEIFAYGFRNPWRMNFSPDGELWVGDVGWELYEMVYRVRSGGNYGWSVMEGPQSVRPEARRGPTPILPPAIALPHTDAASVTGGFVYQGRQFPELQGAYIFGDFETRRIWAAQFDGDVLTSLTDLVRPSVRLVAFGEDASHELLMVDLDAGTIHEFVRNETQPPPQQQLTEFPLQLSQTGLFHDLRTQQPSEGVIEFQIQVPMWHDGADGRRFLTVPGTDAVEVLAGARRRDNWMLREKMIFPKDSVLAKTVTLKDSNGKSVHLETQILHFEGTEWRGYSYLWNPEQTDATLVSADGTSVVLRDYGAFPEQRIWTVHSRSECSRCHNAWVGGPLAFIPSQLNRSVSRATATEAVNQLAALKRAGWLSGAIPDDPVSSNDARIAALADPHNETNSVADRVRSYLSVNCSHCHQNGAGGTATIDLRHEISLNDTHLVDAAPVQGTFGLHQGALLKAGRPDHSVLFYRMACSGRGRMPHIGSSVVDAKALGLVSEWIRSLADDSQPANQAVLPPLSESAAVGPYVDQLQDPATALSVVESLVRGKFSDATRHSILKAARQLPPETRDLFDSFQPPEFQQARRSAFQLAALLTDTGDIDSGRRLFLDEKNQCITCHQVSRRGGQVGPALDDVGHRLSRAAILESILSPSAKIDPRYSAWSVVTHQGAVHSGLLVERTDQSVVLRNVKGVDTKIARGDVEEMIPQPISLMPDRLLNDYTDQQIRDLIAFLSSLRGE
ncbi:MAG: PQQ-dependent sugar dehydrogenase [Planctomycetaceae bacterium]|nr:PQQ-dependent sugar dehydrogenase [Planctomycetaceae bacterium]